MTRAGATSCCVVLAALAVPSQVRADDASTSPAGASAPLTVPDIPALTALGSTASDIDRPGSTSEIGAAVSNLYKGGTVQSGIAIEINLRAFGLGKDWTFLEYQRDWWRRALSQSAISIGTASSANAMDMSVTDIRTALGARVVLWDESDPLLDESYADAAGHARSACRDRPVTEKPACEKAAYDTYAAEMAHWKAPRWNGRGAFVGLAAIEAFRGGALKEHDFEASRVWAAGGLGIGDSFHAAAGITWVAADHAADDVTVAARLRYGNARFRGTLDGAYFVLARGEAAKGKAGVGFEFRLTPSTWLTATAAAEVGASDSPDIIDLLSSIKWGTSEKPSW